MADASLAPSRARAWVTTVARFMAAWVVLVVLFRNEARVGELESLIVGVLDRVLSGFPAAARGAESVFRDFVEIFLMGFATTTVFATLFSVLGAVTRMLARARVRTGQFDFLDRLRGWTAAHARTTCALLAAPALLWAMALAWPGPFEHAHLDEWLAGVGRAFVPLALVAWAIFAMTKKGLRALLAPTMSGVEEPARQELAPREITFDAVAITPETLAMVGLFTAITLAVPAFIWTRPILDLFTQTSIFDFVGAYIAFAAFGAYAFRNASRVEVGVDGVYVRGTSRARFFAYRELDAARIEGADLLLVRGDRVALRLQLHGEDALRRDAVLARIRAGIDRVKGGGRAAAAQLASASTAAQLARAAEGGGDYRGAALTREQLWALVEGPEIDASARKAAAEALARSSDEVERTRLRGAAEQCAEPHVRVALQEAAENADLGEASEASRARSALEA